jgi:hypothetical protein
MNDCISQPRLEPPGLRQRHVGSPRQETSHDVQATVRDLVAQGFDPTEAGNLTAFLHGLAPAKDGWTVDEMEHLLFLRHLVGRRDIEFRPPRRPAR